jgi:hypothetical protein
LMDYSVIYITQIITNKDSFPRFFTAASHVIPDNYQQQTLKALLQSFSAGPQPFKERPGPSNNATMGPLSVLKYEAPIVKI